MSKTNVRWIDFGTGTDQVSSQAIPAAYSPSSYTPDQVSSEGTDKVSAHLKGIDNFLSTLGANFVDEYFTADGVATVFGLVTAIGASTKIDVYWNGVLKEETSDWTRDTVNDEIEISPALPNLTRVRVRVHANDIYAEQFHTADGIASSFAYTSGLADGDKVDVFVNGALMEKGATRDYQIDSTNDEIDFNFTPANNARIRIRVYN